jgi:hypothetical protein
MNIIPFEMEDQSKRLETFPDNGGPDLLVEEQNDKKKINQKRK